MFFTIDEKAPEADAHLSNGTIPSGAAETGHDFGFYFYFVVNNLIQIVTIVLNLFVTGLIVTHRKKTLGTPFYAMTALLMFILCVEGAVNEVNQVLFAGFNVRSGGVQWITTIINIYTSYCSVILIWLLGLNRMAIFVLPRVNEFIFTRVKVAVFLIILVVVMIFVTIWFSHLIGMTVGNGQSFASNMKLLSTINLISYCIPLSSCLFYVKLYWHLRKNREDAGKAAYDTLNKAEVNTASQGVVILLTYLSSMVMHIAMGNLIPKEGTLKLYMNGLKDLIEALPQLVVPMSTIIYSKEMQRLVRSALCMPPKIANSSSNGGSIANRK